MKRQTTNYRKQLEASRTPIAENYDLDTDNLCTAARIYMMIEWIGLSEAQEEFGCARVNWAYEMNRRVMDDADAENEFNNHCEVYMDEYRRMPNAKPATPPAFTI